MSNAEAINKVEEVDPEKIERIKKTDRERTAEAVFESSPLTRKSADIETTRQIQQQKEQRLEAIKAHCRTLEGESLWAMQQHYPELFTDNEETKETVL